MKLTLIGFVIGVLFTLACISLLVWGYCEHERLKALTYYRKHKAKEEGEVLQDGKA